MAIVGSFNRKNVDVDDQCGYHRLTTIFVDDTSFMLSQFCHTKPVTLESFLTIYHQIVGVKSWIQ